MKWGKSKTQLENFLADALKGRIKFHMTSYGSGVSVTQTRAWITLDGKEIVNISTAEWLKEYYANNRQDPGSDVLSRFQFERAIETYLESPIEDAMRSDDPIVKALSMLDYRFGKRRLGKIQLDDTEHELVKLLYFVRCDSEGLMDQVPLNSLQRDP